jgi:hypothetical protein
MVFRQLGLGKSPTPSVVDLVCLSDRSAFEHGEFIQPLKWTLRRVRGAAKNFFRFVRRRSDEPMSCLRSKGSGVGAMP